MPIAEHQRFAGFTARMMEIASTRAAWHRRLWRSGTMQIARELLDESIRPGVREAAVSDQRVYLLDALPADHGIADNGNSVRSVIKEIKPGITDSSHAWINLNAHVGRMHDSYLTNWANSFDSFDSGHTGNRPIDLEGAARRITAHLLDAGMHKSSLYAWLEAIQTNSSLNPTIGDFLREADVRLKRARRKFTFCVPVETRLRFKINESNAPGWMNSTDTAQWKRVHAPNATSVRQYGSFLLVIDAHDVNSAAEQARSIIASLQAKFEIGVRATIKISSMMWSLDKGGDFPTRATNRNINVRAFELQERVQDLSMPTYITNTLALVQPLRTGAPHIAVMSGWSAIESLLVGPSDESDAEAAGRFSLIVAASMVRAELTVLSWRYSKSHQDAAAQRMDACALNIERARLFQMHAHLNVSVDLGDALDNLALNRIRPALSDPRREVNRIAAILTREFTRLYRKRNMIVHGGQIHETNLHSISDTLAPLIGAGIDRIVHVGLKYGVTPIELSAMAEARVHYLTPTTADSPGNLLDLLEF